MIWFLLLLHVGAVLVVAGLGRRLGRSMLVAVLCPMVASTLWSVTHLGASADVGAELVWVEDLGLRLAFWVGPMGALLGLVVSGIGVLVMVYAAGYFSSWVSDTRFFATLLAFSGSMLGLVWADSIWTLFIFWELTSVTSFLLVGHKHVAEAARRAARRALLMTAAGGLCMLGGFVVLADLTGTDRLSEMAPVGNSGKAALAAVLVLVAAATKSAQVPVHTWLPGAMEAPTPVSAYLHSATMVKAGVVLVAFATPVLSSVDVWRPLGLTIGLASVFWGAFGALRHVDAKLVLAYGTISQLGLMVTLLALGSAKATFAALAILVAHAVFKAALFMVVGEVDVRAGTRDLRELSGLARSMPVAAAVALVSGASMAGAGPVLGFPAKEAAIEAALGLTGAEAWLLGGAIVVGSVLTVAYTVRLLLGLFGPSGGRGPTEVQVGRAGLTIPSLVLGLGSVIGFVALGWVVDRVVAGAERIDSGAGAYTLYRWPGFTDAFLVSIAVVAIGGLVGFLASRRLGPAPRPAGAALTDAVIDGTVSIARRVTGRVQHGSLPVYLVTMSATAALATLPFFWAFHDDALYRWDSPLQAFAVALVLCAAVGAALVGSRLGAALGLGGVGLAVTGLFVLHGAPDLAMTQLLVETVVVVGFVLGLGQLRRRFPHVDGIWRAARVAVAAVIAVAVGIALVAAGARPAGRPPLDELVGDAVEEGGGNNLVNVVLTDMRALDTLGEILVLGVVAVGILALARVPRSEANEASTAVPKTEVAP